MARDWLIYLQESDNNKEVKPLLEGILGNFINCTNSKQKSINLLKILETNFTSNPNTSMKVTDIFLTLDGMNKAGVSIEDRLFLKKSRQI